MKTRSPRSRSARLAASAGIVLAAPALSACMVNFDAATDVVYTPAQGVNDRDGQVDVLNALVVSDGTNGRLIAGLANNVTDAGDELVSVESTDAEIEVALGEGDGAIDPGGFLQLADADALYVGVAGLEPGGYAEFTLTFAEAEAVTIDVPVVRNEEEFAEVELNGASQ